MKVDVLLVGQGLAGTLLSYELRQQGLRVCVIDEPHHTHSSRVAAGLYNPITGRKMVKTWWADRLFPLIPEVYGALESLLHKKLLHPMPIYRPFFSVAEQNDWFGQWSDPSFAPYIEKVVTDPAFAPQVHNPYGGLLLRQTGWLNIPLLLDGWRAYLEEEEAFVASTFAEEKLEVQEHKVIYEGIEADLLVYCNGTASSQSQYWRWVPLRPVKGEVLELEADADPKLIPNRGVFLVPVAQGHFRAGSTYQQGAQDTNPTAAARQEIEEKVQSLINFPYRVVGQKAGIRPATKDRRPMLGFHPEHKPLAIFNGLGTKGVSLAPYCAKVLAESIKSGGKLPSEISIERFFSLY